MEQPATKWIYSRYNVSYDQHSVQYLKTESFRGISYGNGHSTPWCHTGPVFDPPVVDKTDQPKSQQDAGVPHHLLLGLYC